MSQESNSKLTRRDLLKGAVAGGLGLAAAGKDREASASSGLPPRMGQRESMIGVPFEPRPVVGVAVIGVGARGTRHVRDLSLIPHVRIRAIADVVEERARRARAVVTESGQPAPVLYTAGERDYENLVRRDDVDLVYIATPWDWHVPMALAAMEAGKHVGVEVSAGHTLDDLWKLVDTSERTRRHCVILENVCYGRDELIVLNMVQRGLLGELKHAEAAYIHELRERLFAPETERFSRRAYHIGRNGNLYPTHGLGPVALDLEINRGDRFDYMVSMSSPQLQLDAYRRERLPADDPRQSEVYRAGDINTSLIKTARGRTIMLQHDVVSPRPYSRINLVSGTRGTVRGYPEPVIFLDPLASEHPQSGRHEWEPLEKYADEYEHRLWKEIGEIARKHGGHGGMDYIMSYRLTQLMKEGRPPDLDVYDAAAWHAPGPLSAASVEKGSAPVEIPDFTRGAWKNGRKAMGTG